MRILAAVLFLAPLTFTTAIDPGVGLLYAGEKNKAPLTDDSIRDQVMMRLAGDQDVKGGGIDVIVKDGAVTLKGQVDTDRARSKASKLAKKVKGVKNVDNELTLKE